MNLDTLQPVISFIKKYGFFLTAAFLLLLFMFLLIFSYTRPPQHSQTDISTSSQTPVSSTLNSPSQEETISTSPSEGLEQDERTLPEWSNTTLSDSDFSDVNPTKTTLPDGSIQYTYDSDVPDRPNIVIVQNGVNIFQRIPFTETSLNDNTNFYGQPDYVAKGSKFWGSNAITYIYLSKGIALVGDTSKDQLFEQMIFKPQTIDQFKQQDTDMISQPQKP